ncbi:hypothetical protein I79_013634 [Cricetulus griseus]|uniref:Uncharacterized protein n=1 Tax=Cricetulus griseus TaxID=10029 RepID=G3HS09_CRIGR|nr:hypothetical protein I79_013634 [Cricetulus griseus]
MGPACLEILARLPGHCYATWCLPNPYCLELFKPPAPPNAPTELRAASPSSEAQKTLITSTCF